MSEYLIHHGVKGMRWGVRRYQNEDGTYTSLGKKEIRKEKRKRSISKIRRIIKRKQ